MTIIPILMFVDKMKAAISFLVSLLFWYVTGSKESFGMYLHKIYPAEFIHSKQDGSNYIAAVLASKLLLCKQGGG